MLVQRLRRCINIDPTMGEYFMFAVQCSVSLQTFQRSPLFASIPNIMLFGMVRYVFPGIFHQNSITGQGGAGCAWVRSQEITRTDGPRWWTLHFSATWCAAGDARITWPGCHGDYLRKRGWRRWLLPITGSPTPAHAFNLKVHRRHREPELPRSAKSKGSDC